MWNFNNKIELLYKYVFFKVFENKGRTAVFQISFLERNYFEIYMGVAKHLKICVIAERVKREQIIYLKHIWFYFSLVSQSIRNAFFRLLVRRQPWWPVLETLKVTKFTFLWVSSGPWLPLRKHFPCRLKKVYHHWIGKHTH